MESARQEQGVQTVEIQLAPDLLQIFFPLFQQGVELEVEVGCTIKQLLTEQFGISSDYLAARITTLFLNSKAIDDAAMAVVRDGSVLALSGAMPGMVGATMRSGGHLAAMRGAMTYSDVQQAATAKSGRIKVKLFNLLLSELGPKLLTWGILLSGTQFKSFLAEQPVEFRFRKLSVDGKPVAAGQLLSEDWLNSGAQVKVKVFLGDES
jgi:hypothetical protein